MVFTLAQIDCFQKNKKIAWRELKRKIQMKICEMDKSN